MFEASDAAVTAAHQFRNILDAMSRPGRRVVLHGPPDAQGPVSAGALGILFALCDYQTPVHLADGLDDEAVLKRLKFETGAPSAAQRSEALFAVMNARQALSLLPHFSVGTHEYPDRSTTLLIQLGGDPGDAVEFSGPGVGAPCTVLLPGISRDFWQALGEINAGYPLGLDVIFVDGDTLLACPRSTRVKILEAH